MRIKPSYKKNIIILLIWVLIFASAPLYMLYEEFIIDSEVDWQELTHIWSYEAGFLVIFLIHHYWMLPQLVYRRRFKLYALCYLPLLTAFGAFLLFLDPKISSLSPFHKDQPFKNEAPPPRFGAREKDGKKPFHDGEKPFHDDEKPFHNGKKPFHDDGPIDIKDSNSGHDRPPAHKHFKPRKKHGPLPAPILAKLVIAALMMGVDFGIVAWRRQQMMGQRLLLLERLNLERELEHLRQQINPHFLMNTLNNIHALVDIDSERTKRAIVQLSCLMRYALYHGSETMVPLAKDLEALDVYFQLVRLRYSNKVDIHFRTLEGDVPTMQVPPLIFATFIENAFKHGISYRHSSYVHASLQLTDDGRRLLFQCINSRHTQTDKQPTANPKKGEGIGLQNVRKRLDLLYEDRYTLTINDTNPNTYSIELTLPISQT